MRLKNVVVVTAIVSMLIAVGSPSAVFAASCGSADAIWACPGSGSVDIGVPEPVVAAPGALAEVTVAVRPSFRPA
jgi:hypothetical protein